MSCDESFTRRLTLEHACWLKICHHEKRRERLGPNCICFRITNHNSTKSHRGLHVPGFQLIFNNGEGFFPCMANMWDEITHPAMFRNALATGRSIFRVTLSLAKKSRRGGLGWVRTKGNCFGTLLNTKARYKRRGALGTSGSFVKIGRASCRERV